MNRPQPVVSTSTRPTVPAPKRRFPRLAALGALPTGERMERILRSPNFADGAFRNPPGPATPVAPAPTDPPTRPGGSGAAGGTRSSLVRSYRQDRQRRAPTGRIPVADFTAATLAVPPTSGLRLTWMGHASVLTEIDGHRVLFDPVWSERCSPLSFVGPRRLHPVPGPLGDLGPLDVVVISHDHYDHLDHASVRTLAATGVHFAVPLGVGAHLERWGVPGSQFTELDWNESVTVRGLTLTATPARHFCGRSLRSPQQTLWASWVVAGADHRVFHSGDTGYFPGFAEIGAQHGPFDATMIQIGAYSPHWPDIHMTPEEGVRSHLDLNPGEPGTALLPIHWGTFNLAFHPWEEPAERTVAAARAAGVPVVVPPPGRPFEPAEPGEQDPWWRAIAAPAGKPAAP